MNKLRKNFDFLFNQKAQTALELAIFGSVLVFVIGLIVRQTLGYTYIQNQTLKAMRLAMQTSFEYSEGLKGADPFGYGSASRNQTTVLFVEDRLTAGSEKYGVTTRVPHVVSGSGTHSRNLFMQPEDGEAWNRPMIDVYVNGKHFPFSVAAFKDVDMKVRDSAGLPRDDVDLISGCFTHTETFAGLSRDHWDQACTAMYVVSHNHPDNDNWAVTETQANLQNNLSVHERFDLDHDDTTFCAGCIEGADVPVAERADFAWQWWLAVPVREKSGEISEGTYATESWKTTIDIGDQVSIGGDEPKNVMADVDGDGAEEQIVWMSGANYRGYVEKVRVLDYQDGDLDFTQSNQSDKPQAGFTNDVQSFTRVEEGTYFLLEEGQLCSCSGSDCNQCVKTTSKKNQVDVIQRVIQLSNNTGRFCSIPVYPAAPIRVSDVDFDGDPDLPNPVEVCCDPTPGAGDRCSNGTSGCFDSDNLDLTCMDTANLLIYSRSRLADRHGRKWITTTGDDEYVNFWGTGTWQW